MFSILSWPPEKSEIKLKHAIVTSKREKLQTVLLYNDKLLALSAFELFRLKFYSKDQDHITKAKSPLILHQTAM